MDPAATVSPTQSVPSAQASPESPPSPGAGIVPSTSPVRGSIFRITASAIWNRCFPSNAVPASAATSSAPTMSPLWGSRAFSLSPEANQTRCPSKLTPCTPSIPGNGPYSRRISAGACFMSSC
jgi:hypothetical protein